MAKPPYVFADSVQYALRLTGWRVLDTQADRAWRGEIIATVSATGLWAVTEKGETVAIGGGEDPIASAVAALSAAIDLKVRREGRPF